MAIESDRNRALIDGVTRPAGRVTVGWLLSALLVVIITGCTIVFLGALGPWFFTSRGVQDVGIFAGAASRILAGQVPYRDFFLFVGPIGPYITAAGFTLLGETATAMISLTVLIGVLTALGTHWMARLMLPRLLAAVAAL